LNIVVRSPVPTDMLAITPAIESTTWINPQNVPNRPRKISSPVR
jgi:hypothetical protein